MVLVALTVHQRCYGGDQIKSIQVYTDTNTTKELVSFYNLSDRHRSCVTVSTHKCKLGYFRGISGHKRKGISLNSVNECYWYYAMFNLAARLKCENE